MLEEEGITVLSVLSVTAMFTTISLFFCGIPICLDVWRRRSTKDISGFPFVMGFLGGTFWLRYGMIKMDFTMITVNCVGVSLMFAYMLFYLHFTKPKGSYLMQMAAVSAMISLMLVLVEIFRENALDPLGFVSMMFNIINFGAPLAGMRVVLRKRSVEDLPLPLCMANFLVSSQWCLYGVLIKDIYLIIPNGAGASLALIQVMLFLIFPRTTGGKAPFNYCCPCLCESGMRGKIALDNHYERVTTLPPSRVPSRASRNGRVHDREIPASRDACIDFLRSNEFTSGRFRGAFDSSMSSRITHLSSDENGRQQQINGAVVQNGDLNRNSSLSHPELWDGKIIFPVDSTPAFDSSIASTTPLVQNVNHVADSGFFGAEQQQNEEKQAHQMIRTSSAPDLAVE